MRGDSVQARPAHTLRLCCRTDMWPWNLVPFSPAWAESRACRMLPLTSERISCLIFVTTQLTPGQLWNWANQWRKIATLSWYSRDTDEGKQMFVHSEIWEPQSSKFLNDLKNVFLPTHAVIKEECISPSKLRNVHIPTLFYCFNLLCESGNCLCDHW